MTPLGHASVSYVTGRYTRYLSCPAVIAGGLLPDTDFIFILFDWFNNIHRVVSHNVFFVILASCAAAMLARDTRKMVIFMSVLSGGLIHLLIDSAMDINPTNGLGIAALWPLNSTFFSPFNLLTPVPEIPGWDNPLTMVKYSSRPCSMRCPFTGLLCLFTSEAGPSMLPPVQLIKCRFRFLRKNH